MCFLFEEGCKLIVYFSMVQIPNDVYKIHLFNKLGIEGRIRAIVGIFVLPSRHIKEDKVSKLGIFISNIQYIGLALSAYFLRHITLHNVFIIHDIQCIPEKVSHYVYR